jgi:EAL domain-containing protein (putative c-di-GMP-specific phosphodiesterase class I)
MNTSALQKLTLESSLHKALERNEFTLYYQPKVDVRNGAMIIGAEALIRWNHPELGTVSPLDFIPLAEATGLIVPIGEWVLRSTCAQLRRWHDAGFTFMQVAINMSSRNFEQESFDKTITQALGDWTLEAGCLKLEMTEGTLMQDAETMVAKLKRLKATGVQLSMDDFGTGYSSLSYLKRFPLDELKIDRSFVRDITINSDDAAITSAIIAMAKSLNLSVIAEGVETEAQAALLGKQGCHFMQGYLFSRPVPADQFTQLLRKQCQLSSAPLDDAQRERSALTAAI